MTWSRNVSRQNKYGTRQALNTCYSTFVRLHTTNVLALTTSSVVTPRRRLGL
jgi:hypothetical protein